MYRKIYRQEGGLAEEGYRAQISQAREKAIEDWNRRTRGEVAERVRPRPRRAYRPANIPLDTERQQEREGLAALPEARLPEARSLKYGVGDQTTGDPINLNPTLPISKYLLNMPEIARLEVDRGGGYTGKPSDARHQAASHEMRKRISDIVQKANLNMTPREYTDFLGNLTTNLAGGWKEGLSYLYNTFNLWDDISEKEARAMGMEDLKANWEGTFGIPTGEDMTPEQIYEKVYKEDEGGLADLPEAQTVDTYKDKIYPQISFKDLPPNYQEYINNLPPNQQRSELAKIPPGYMPKPTYVKDKGWGYTEFDPFDEIPYYREFYNVPSREDIIPAGQPTGFEETGYGGLSPQGQVYYTDSTGQTLYPGRLGLDYGDPGFMPDFEKKYTESPYKTSWEAWNNRVNQSVPTQPTGFAGTGYGQFSPQAAGGVYTPTGDPGLRPAGTTPTNVNTRPYQPLAAY